MIKRVLYFGNPAYLSLRSEQLVLRLPEVEKSDMTERSKQELQRTIPIEDIGVVVLDHQQITITHGLMAALLGNNVAIITCNEQHLPVGLQLPLCGNSVQNERFRKQIDASLPLQKQLWQQTMQQKIRNQAAILRKVGAEERCMLAWAKDVRSGDPDNLEGRAAAYYWRNIFPSQPNFVRGQEGESPNYLLNYGYAVVRALVARALVSAGLLPTLGIHHHNRYNAYCLADDIMEPYRPYVDSVVVDMMREGLLSETLTVEMKQRLWSIPVMDVLIDGHKSPMMVAVQSTANSLQKCFAGDTKTIIYPYCEY